MPLSLFHIAQSENDDRLRDTAIVTLGKVGGREQLRILLARASKETRLAVIRGLFLARDDDGLIRVAEQEKDPELRSEVLNRLRLIGTPKAKEYLRVGEIVPVASPVPSCAASPNRKLDTGNWKSILPHSVSSTSMVPLDNPLLDNLRIEPTPARRRSSSSARPAI